MENGKYVLTGGPSAGKSAILEVIQLERNKDYEFYTVAEVATDLIKRELKKEKKGEETVLVPWKNPLAFQKAVLKQQLEWEKDIPDDKVSILDRGAYDGIAYLNVNNEEIFEEMKNVVRPNYSKIFILDMLPFKETEVRQDKHLAESLDKELERVYKGFGYEVVRVPVLPIQERVDYILARL